jgi:hypothetical protein
MAQRSPRPDLQQCLRIQKDRLRAVFLYREFNSSCKPPHGSFLPWIEAEFAMSERAAPRFMEVGREYADKSASVAGLNSAALYELAAPSTPPEVQAEVERRIAARLSRRHPSCRSIVLALPAGGPTGSPRGSDHWRIDALAGDDAGLQRRPEGAWERRRR